MKAFIYKTLFLGFIIIAILFVGEMMVRTLPNPYTYKHQWMLKNSSKVETLIFGSSHTYYGIDPAYIDGNAFNLASVSQNFEYDYILLQKYNCKNLKQIVVPVSYFSLFSCSLEDDPYEWLYAVNYKIYMDINVHSVFSKYNFELFRLSVFKEKLDAKVRDIIYGDFVPSYNELGHGLDFKKANKLPEWYKSESVVKRHTYEYNNSDFLMNMGYLKDIIAWCNNHSVKVILITTPTWHTYYANLDKTQLARMYAAIATLTQKYKIPYLDYLKDDRFNEDDFYDSDHLSDVGAVKFTKILNNDIFNHCVK